MFGELMNNYVQMLVMFTKKLSDEMVKGVWGILEREVTSNQINWL